MAFLLGVLTLAFYIDGDFLWLVWFILWIMVLKMDER